MTIQVEGYPVLVDPIDAHLLKTHKWRVNKHGYVTRRTSRRVPGLPYPVGVHVYLHREIAGLTHKDGLEVDHRNRDPLDNRRANLRIVTREENAGICKTDPTAVVGVAVGHPDQGVVA